MLLTSALYSYLVVPEEFDILFKARPKTKQWMEKTGYSLPDGWKDEYTWDSYFLPCITWEEQQHRWSLTFGSLLSESGAFENELNSIYDVY